MFIKISDSIKNVTSVNDRNLEIQNKIIKSRRPKTQLKQMN